MKPAFGRERLNDATLRAVRQQSQRAIEARLAAAIGPRHDVEGLEPNPHVTQRAIARNRDLRDHAWVRLDGSTNLQNRRRTNGNLSRHTGARCLRFYSRSIAAKS